MTLWIRKKSFRLSGFMALKFTLAAAIYFILITYTAYAREIDDDAIPLTYTYKKSADGTITVSPMSPYLDLLKMPTPDIPILPWRPCCFPYFKWDFPALSVKTLNNTLYGSYFSEIIFDVSKSNIDTEPVIIIERNFEGMLYFFNEGWGPVLNPSLKFKLDLENLPPHGDTSEFFPRDQYSRRNLEQNQSRQMIVEKDINLAGFDSELGVSFLEFLPDDLLSKKYGFLRPSRDLSDAKATISAQLTYKNIDGKERNLSFSGDVYFGPPPSPFFPPSPKVYTVKLTAGEAPATIRVPISQLVSSGGVDNFLIRVASDRSGHFEFALRLRSVDGNEYPGGHFVLDTFIPRQEAKSMK